MYRIRVANRCIDYVSAMQNARYPTVAEGSNRTAPTLKPVHDWTNHYRTATEYGISWITKNEVKQKKEEPVNRVVVKRDKVTGKLIYSRK